MTSLALALFITIAVLGVSEILPYLRRYHYFLVDESNTNGLTQHMWVISLQGAIGFGICGTALLIMGVAGFISRAFIFGLTGVLVTFFIVKQIKAVLGNKKQAGQDKPDSEQYLSGKRRPEIKLGVESLALLIFVAGVGVLLWVTILPVIEVDDITYHLSVPKAYITEGRIFPVPLNAHSNWHFLSEMSYLWAFALHPQSVITPKLLELIRCIMLAMAVGGFAGWLYNRKVGLVCASLVLLFEEVSRWGTISHTDVGQALFLFLGIALIGKWLSEPEQKIAMVYGSALLGFGIAVKHTGIAIAFATILSAFITRVIYRKCLTQQGFFPLQLIKELALLIIPALIVVSPWLIKNAVYTSDPFYPFFSSVFPVKEDFLIPLKDAVPSFAQIDKLLDFKGDHFKRFTIHVHTVISNTRITNVNGYLVLFPLAALLMIINKGFSLSYSGLNYPNSSEQDFRRRESKSSKTPKLLQGYHPVKIFLLLTILITSPFFLRAPYGRFLIAIYPVALIVFIGEAYLLLSSKKRKWVVDALLVLFLFYFFVNFIECNRFDQADRRTLGVPPYMPTFTASAEEHYYEQYEPSIKIIKKVNAMLKPNDRLLASLGKETLPLLSVRFLPNAPLVSKPAITTLVAWGKSAEEIALWMKKHSITHILTEEPLDSDTAKEFRDKYLQLLCGDSDSRTRLFRVKI